MGALTIMEKNADCNDAIDWPLFYMNDFSVLGLLVDRLAPSLEVLEADGYAVERHNCSARVHFEDNRRYHNIFEILRRHRIDYGMSDLVRCVYQG